MKCSVFIATSADGYIATKDGGVDWLEKSGYPDVDMSQHPDVSLKNYMATVDCLVMGRNCMEKLSSFNLKPEQWPYGDTPVFALSNSVKVPPDNLKNKVEVVPGDIPALVSRLKSEGFKHVYVDGGSIITSFLNLGLINEMTISRAPILLGDGIPLIGKLNKHIRLEESQAKAFPNGFVQEKYKVNYE